MGQKSGVRFEMTHVFDRKSGQLPSSAGIFYCRYLLPMLALSSELTALLLADIPLLLQRLGPQNALSLPLLLAELNGTNAKDAKDANHADLSTLASLSRAKDVGCLRLRGGSREHLQRLRRINRCPPLIRPGVMGVPDLRPQAIIPPVHVPAPRARQILPLPPRRANIPRPAAQGRRNLVAVVVTTKTTCEDRRNTGRALKTAVQRRRQREREAQQRQHQRDRADPPIAARVICPVPYNPDTQASSSTSPAGSAVVRVNGINSIESGATGSGSLSIRNVSPAVSEASTLVDNIGEPSVRCEISEPVARIITSLAGVTSESTTANIRTLVAHLQSSTPPNLSSISSSTLSPCSSLSGVISNIKVLQKAKVIVAFETMRNYIQLALLVDWFAYFFRFLLLLAECASHRELKQTVKYPVPAQKGPPKRVTQGTIAEREGIKPSTFNDWIQKGTKFLDLCQGGESSLFIARRIFKSAFLGTLYILLLLSVTQLRGKITELQPHDLSRLALELRDPDGLSNQYLRLQILNYHLL